MNLLEILRLKFPNANFTRDIILQDDGNGSYIKNWPEDLGNTPTQQDLDSWADEMDLNYRQNIVREKRASLYPSWQEQMDMQYWDSVNGTTVWKDTIESIKQSNPIPEE